MRLAELYLNRYLYRDNDQDSETKDSSFLSADSSEDLGAPITSGGAAQDVNQGNVMIDSALIPSTTINVGDYGWTQSCTFSSDDTDTVIWGGGTFIDAAGNSYTIDAGTTGDMAAKTYIYLSLLESETEYQKSVTSSDSVGTGKVLIAVAKNETDAATFNLVQAEQIVGDNILVNTIDAGKIVVGSLIVGTNVAIGTAEDAAGVTTIVGNTVTTSYVNALSITATGQITAGSMLVVNGGNTVGFTPAGTNAIFSGPTGSPAFYVTPAGALTATSVTITGDVTATAGSDWTGNAIAAAYIGNLDAGKITTGSLTVTRTDAKCTDANADQTSVNTSADTSAVNGLASSSVSGWAHGSDTTKINGGDIYTGTVTATQITVTSLDALSVNAGDIRVGGSGNTYGSISVKDSSGTEVALLNNNAIIVRQNKAFAAESSTSGTYTQFYTAGLNGIIEITNNTSGSFGIKDDDSSNYLMQWSNYDISSYKSILPLVSTIDLGSSTYKWDDIFTATLKGLYGEIYLDQSGRIEFTNHCDPSGAGSYNLGGSTRYWADVSYKTLTDRGCLGYFDDGVELQDGTKVSDIEALQAIKKHPTKKTIYGAPMLDYTTFPKVSYIKAKDHEGNEYERDSKGEPKEIDEEYKEVDADGKKIKKTRKLLPADGIEMTSMFSIMIGAFKELDNRLKLAENEIELLKTKEK